MPHITRIAIHPRHRHQFQLYLDDQLFCTVPEQTLVRYQLAKGQQLSEEQCAAILQDVGYQRLRQVALHYLSYSARSTAEVRRKLAQWCHDNDQEALLDTCCEPLITELQQCRYLDDAAYAMQFADLAMRNAHSGPQLIRQQLHHKHLADHHIDAALAHYDVSLQDEHAHYWATKLWAKTNRNSQRAYQDKLIRTIQQKGFSYECSKRAVCAAAPKPDRDHEYRNLVRIGSKLLSRYRNKYAHDAAVYAHLTQALRQKGFDAELIQFYIEEEKDRDHNE